MIDYVALTIRGETLNPDEVTDRLGVEPSRAFARGDLDIHPTPTRSGYWRLRIDGRGRELNRCLEDLIHTIDGRETDVAELGKRYETEIAIVADLTGYSEGELIISYSVLAQIALMSTGLRFYWLYAERDSGSQTQAED